MDRGGRSNAKDNGFDGMRFRKLQLERNGSSLPVDDNGSSPPDTFRRWNSMNETGKHGGQAYQWNNGTTTPSSTVYPSFARTKYRDEPVVYVLPAPNKKVEINGLSHATANAPSYSAREKTETSNWDLKYPHGMPRWGPKPFASSSLQMNPSDNDQPNHNTTKTSYDPQQNTNNNPTHEDNPNNKPKSSSKTKKTEKQKAVVEKAKAQSMMAAARAVQNIAPGSSPTKKMASYSKPGLTSRLFGRGPKKSLLQSARIKQAHLMHTERQSQSLDDSFRQQRQGARSVQSFEFLQSTTSLLNKHKIVQVESNSEGDDALSIDESVANESDDDDAQQLEGPSESQSWSMASDSSEDKLSIDESVDDSKGDDPPESEFECGSESEDAKQQPRTPQSYSIPTMILSEGDPESVSRNSDYSSLELKTSKDSVGLEEEDEFFDAKDGLKASTERFFDAKRCRELLRLRNQYLEQEEQGKLLSPQAASRLYNAPSLCRGTDEKTLMELATRSKWMEQTMPNNAHAASSEITISSPFSAYAVRNFQHGPALASMPDEGPDIEPISLAAPRTLTLSQPAIIRKKPWHVENASYDEDEGGAATREGVVEAKDTHGVPNTPKTPFKVKLKLFLFRFLYFVLFLIWSTRALLRLRDSFTSEGVNSCESAITVSDDNEEVPAGEILFDNEFRWANLSSLRFQPATTSFKWTDMSILLVDPSPAEPNAALEDFEDSGNLPLSKCPANFSKSIRKFWENMRLNRQAVEVEEASILLDFPSPDDMFIVDMLQGQSYCNDAINMCSSTRDAVPVIHLQDVIGASKLKLDIDTFIDDLDWQAESDEGEGAEPRKPLLISIGERLRKHGQQFLEEQKKMRTRKMRRWP